MPSSEWRLSGVSDRTVGWFSDSLQADSANSSLTVLNDLEPITYLRLSGVSGLSLKREPDRQSSSDQTVAQSVGTGRQSVGCKAAALPTDDHPPEPGVPALSCKSPSTSSICSSADRRSSAIFSVRERGSGRPH